MADHVAIAMQRIRLLESLERHARAAEAANEAKSQFLANMSHELRTPMNAILGMIDVALPKAADPTVQDCLQTAKGSADLLLDPAERPAGLRQDRVGQAGTGIGPVQPAARCWTRSRGSFPCGRARRDCCFCCRMPDEVPDALVGDRVRLQQILLNLAGNAIKFTERGEVEISLRAPVAGRRQPAWSLPCGTRESASRLPARTRLFQPFAQADASMARRFGGTGLGLSISKSLVEMMGGRIWVESERGQGQHVLLHRPAAVGRRNCLPSSRLRSMSRRRPTRSLRILLVEDNPANQKLARYILAGPRPCRRHRRRRPRGGLT